MPRSAPDPSQLPPAELEILAHLWRHGSSTSRQIRDALAPRRPMAHASALTLLARLEAKGLVTRAKEPDTRGYLYSPTRRPGPTYRRLVRDLTDRIFGGSAVQLVSSLFAGRAPTRKELDELKKLLQDLESQK
jgi:BlaI family transcriptional regulator, penicillinase repressor